MRKLFILLFILPLAAGCVGMATTDGDSTKKWLEVVSSKRDLDGKILDVCYRFNLRINPQEALKRVDTDQACITKCCWISAGGVTEINFNKTFVSELVNQGEAKKYTPDALIINVSYSPIIKAVSGKIIPKDAISGNNVVNLDTIDVKSPETVSKVASDANIIGKNTATNSFEGGYLYKTNVEEKGAVFGKTMMTTSTTIHPDGSVTRDTKVIEDKKPETPISREKLLEKKLAEERQEAVKLVRRFFAQDIDSYIMTIDKSKKSQNLVLLANKRDWGTTKISSSMYEVSCKVEGSLGKDLNSMSVYPIDCGVYQADLANQRVAPKDIVAKAIVEKTYSKKPIK